MTIEEHLKDEIKNLNELVVFFEKIKYEVAVRILKARIKAVEDKLNNLDKIETIY